MPTFGFSGLRVRRKRSASHETTRLKVDDLLTTDKIAFFRASDDRSVFLFPNRRSMGLWDMTSLWKAAIPLLLNGKSWFDLCDESAQSHNRERNKRTMFVDDIDLCFAIIILCPYPAISLLRSFINQVCISTRTITTRTIKAHSCHCRFALPSPEITPPPGRQLMSGDAESPLQGLSRFPT